MNPNNLDESSLDFNQMAAEVLDMLPSTVKSQFGAPPAIPQPQKSTAQKLSDLRALPPSHVRDIAIAVFEKRLEQEIAE